MQAVKLMPSLSRGLRLWAVAAFAVMASLLVPVSADAVAGVPQDVTAESLGNNTVQVSWTKVPEALSYVVEYSTSSSFSSPQVYQRDDKPTEPVAYVGGLTRDTKYYFRVYSVLDAQGTKSQASGSDSATPKYEYGAVDGINESNIGGTFAEVEWVFNTATLGTPGWRIRAEAVADRDGDAHFNDVGSDPVGKVTGLKKNTTYYVWVASLLPANGDAPAVRVGPYSKAIKVTTSNYAVNSPTDLKMNVQKSESITLGWTAPDNIRPGDKYVVEYAKSASMSGSKPVSATETTSKTVAPLTANVNYFMRVHVVDANGTRVSDKSDVLQTKTPTIRGTITGHVNGATTKDLVVTAYQTKSGAADRDNLVEESDVNPSTGNYTLAVRPGTYRVHVAYVGSGNTTSLWAKSGSNGKPIWDEASDLVVTGNQATTAPAVTLGIGAPVNGSVEDPAGASLKSVDVTARSCYSEGSSYKRDVMAMTTTDSQGRYQLRGLPDGQYWLRWVYNSGDGFNAYATAVNVVGAKVVDAQPSGSSCLAMENGPTIDQVNVTMSPRTFRKTYSIHVYGSRKVGTTLKSKFNKWIGDQYGSSATHSKMEWVWLRDGKEIAGTSGNTTDNSSGARDYCSSIRCFPTYKLTSADRRHYVSLQVTYSRYGYITYTKTYKKFKVR